MIDVVTVKVAELLKKAQELTEAGYEYVDIDEMDADGDLPKALHFDAYDGHGAGIDFEEIEHIEVDSYYKDN